MSTTVLHPNALPGIPWTFLPKAQDSTIPFAGTAYFTLEAIARNSVASESITSAGFTNEAIEKC